MWFMRKVNPIHRPIMFLYMKCVKKIMKLKKYNCRH